MDYLEYLDAKNAKMEQMIVDLSEKLGREPTYQEMCELIPGYEHWSGPIGEDCFCKECRIAYGETYKSSK